MFIIAVEIILSRIPNQLIRINPAKSEPMVDPTVFNPVISPYFLLWEFSFLTSKLVINGNVKPNKMVGTNMIKAEIKSLNIILINQYESPKVCIILVIDCKL